MKNIFLTLILSLTLLCQAYSQNKLGKAFQIDLTPHNFFNAGMFDNSYNGEFLEVQENSYLSPSIDLSVLLQRGTWNFGAGVSGLGVRKSLSINWIDGNSSSLNREVDGFYNFEQWRLGVHLLTSYRIGSFDFGLKFAVYGLVAGQVEAYNMEFVSLWGIQEGNNLVELHSVDVEKKMIGNSIRQSTTRVDCFYMINSNWGVGLNATFWNYLNPNDYDNFKMQLTYSKESDSESSVDPKLVGDFNVNNPLWQIGATIRINLSKFKVPGNTGENRE